MTEKYIKGGCSCGNIQYQIEGSPEFSFHCQCRQCQRITGAGHASQLMIHTKNVTIIGKIKLYKQSTDGNNTKCVGFCGVCGNPILTKVLEYPDTIYFHAASLEKPELFNPEKILYSDSKQPWDYTNPNIPED